MSRARLLSLRRIPDAIGECIRHRLPAMPRTLHEPDLAMKRRVFER
jgi:hypothetical protein